MAPREPRMSFMTDEGPSEVPIGDVFSDIPLFREIQRVLLSSSGPVNWELARQVGIAVAVGNANDPAPDEKDRRGFEDAVRVAELQVADFTGLSAPGEVAQVRPMRRAQWVEANITGLKEIVEPAAAKVGAAFEGLRKEEAGEAEEARAISATLGQISPLLLGAQVGMVLGYLGQYVLGQFDIAVPRPGPVGLYFVLPNIASFEQDWSLEPIEFREWVALHEVTHRFEFARPWARDHFTRLLNDFVETLELDVSGVQERIERMDIANPEAMQSLFESGEGLFGAILDDEQRLKLERIQAFMAAAEGYGDHVMHGIGRKMLSTYSQIEEAMRRYRETETGDPVFERLLGIEMKREQYRLGRAFCDQVADATEERVLARMWDSPESLPSMPELIEPTLWMSRSV